MGRRLVPYGEVSRVEIVAADIGGTHARFALAGVGADGIVLGPEMVLKTGDHAGLEQAWAAFGEAVGRPLPAAAGIAIAAPLDGDRVTMTNNRWVIRRSRLSAELGLAQVTLVNDFAAVAHAVANCPASDLRHVCGPEGSLPLEGVVSIVGPGTGLGVAILHRSRDGDRVFATEGGHIEFAPLDRLEQRLRDLLAERHGRVSVERIVSGAGLAAIYEAMTGREAPDQAELWRLALSGSAPAAVAALDQFCKTLGAVAGDLALAHGAHSAVIAGGLGLRLADRLSASGFADRFVDKGRYRDRMAALPVKLIAQPQPGLFGAAAAFAAEHRQ